MEDFRSSLLDEALRGYKTELKDHDDFILDVNSIEDLLDQAQSLEIKLSPNNGPSAVVGRLRPILSDFSTFAASMTLCFGAHAETAALVWGSIQMILRVRLLGSFKPPKDAKEYYSLYLPLRMC